MRKAVTLFAGILLCLFSHAITKIVQSNSGNGWGTQTNWLPNGVPQDGDVVIIPPGFTISIKGNVYTSAINLTIYVHGNLDFEPSGKLNLGSNSVVQLTTSTSSITSNNTSSEQIVIGGGIKYNGSNDGTVTGPAFTTYSSPNSIAGKAKTSFTFGVLPIKLTTFTVQENNGRMVLNWTTVQEENLKGFELQRSQNGRNWLTIATQQPKNTCGCTTNYQYNDKAPNAGTNYYRLHSIDWDGRSEYSAVIMANANAVQGNDVVWRMNGASSLTISIKPTGFQFPVVMKLLTSNGQVLMNQSLSSTITTLNIQPIPVVCALWFWWM